VGEADARGRSLRRWMISRFDGRGEGGWCSAPLPFSVMVVYDAACSFSEVVVRGAAHGSGGVGRLQTQES
jgi:hypothetical protein